MQIIINTYEIYKFLQATHWKQGLTSSKNFVH